jgi:hypothetical protein
MPAARFDMSLLTYSANDLAVPGRANYPDKRWVCLPIANQPNLDTDR